MTTIGGMLLVTIPMFIAYLLGDAGIEKTSLVIIPFFFFFFFIEKVHEMVGSFPELREHGSPPVRSVSAAKPAV